MRAVGILEDNNNLRDNIKQFLTLSGEFSIAFSVPDMESLTNIETEVEPDYILLDVHLKDQNSLDGIDILQATYPKSEIIVITGDLNEQLILKSVAVGARGFLRKPFTMSELISAIKQTETHGFAMNNKMVATLLKQIHHTAIKRKKADDVFELTKREIEIIEMAKQGLAYKQISNAMGISYHTVNHHLKNIYTKMSVKSRAELLAKYI